mmetsp:Transcript_40056/g.100220  ORF Transcript_40056/g.100220 Transcript_40056/m.100220 type:complete len:87 (+) Transcript_40056:1215-1475(+)
MLASLLRMSVCLSVCLPHALCVAGDLNGSLVMYRCTDGHKQTPTGLHVSQDTLSECNASLTLLKNGHKKTTSLIRPTLLPRFSSSR